MVIEKAVNERFQQFIFDWQNEQYLIFGGYGSSKSYNVALKIILKLLHEKRKALVIREVFDTIKESCFDLLVEILDDMNLLATEGARTSTTKCITNQSPMQIKFPNGSRIIFKGMDKPNKLKSINGVSIVWLEECSEIKYSGFTEMLGRLRTPDTSTHFFLTTNPVGTDNWVYKHFFKDIDDEGNEIVKLDDELVYKLGTVVKNGIYYHHSVPEDNVFLPKSYIKRLDSLKEYDMDLYRIARLGRFGQNGIKVLPQFEVADTHADVLEAIQGIGRNFRFCGMDFGFEASYNAVVRLAVDDANKILYIYDEYYKNHMTDDKTAKELEDKGYMDDLIWADSAEPKTIQFYRQQGFKMRACHKFQGSRIADTKKIKRFRKIICSPNCKNTIRELRTLTYKKDNKGDLIYDEFNIDPHTFSAIWYALDRYTVADIKQIKRNSRKGVSI